MPALPAPAILQRQDALSALLTRAATQSGGVPLFADIRLRSGYVGESRYGLLNLLYRAPRSSRPSRPMREHYAQLAEAPGASLPVALAAPRLRVDTAVAAATAHAFGFAAPPVRNIVLCPGAEYGPAKRWPAERFGALRDRDDLVDTACRAIGADHDSDTHGCLPC